MFSISNILSHRAVALTDANRPLHAIGVGSNCTVRLTRGINIHVIVLANKAARTVHGQCRKLNIRSVCVKYTIGVGACSTFLRGCRLSSRRVVCINSSVPSCRMVHHYNYPYYPTSTYSSVGRVSYCISSTGNNRKINESVMRRILHTGKR